MLHKQSNLQRGVRLFSYETYIGFDWKSWWKEKLPPRLLMLGWRMVWHMLPMAYVLRRKNIMVDELCVLCFDGLKTVSHVFIPCPVASRLWHGLLGVRTSCFRMSSFVDL